MRIASMLVCAATLGAGACKSESSTQAPPGTTEPRVAEAKPAAVVATPPEAPKVEVPVEAPKVEVPKVEAPVEVPKVEALEVLNPTALRERVKSLAAKRTLVTVWATKCEPCIKEMPALVAFYEKYRGDGLRVLGICDDDRTAADAASKIQTVLDAVRPTFPMAVLEPGKDAAMFQTLGLTWDGGLPVTMVFDDQGHTLFYSQETMNEAKLTAEVLPLVRPQ
jgi:thiol-disulfide isomerase/thioredoxin